MKTRLQSRGKRQHRDEGPNPVRARRDGIAPNLGFTMIEMVIAIALVAIMATAVSPMIASRINQGREQATERELARIQVALMAYYDDVGAFPAEDLGLGALVNDSGAGGWEGPYVTWSRNDPTAALSSDEFGEDYIYDLAPSTSPGGAANLVVASMGVNHSNDVHQDGTWDLTLIDQVDDCVILLSAAGPDREKHEATRLELKAIDEACRAYYRENGGFPAVLDSLAGEFLDRGIRNAAFVDGWGKAYQSDLSFGQNPVLRVWSRGADQGDDNGSNDDMLLEIHSKTIERESIDGKDLEPVTPEDGNYTRFLIETAQAALDGQPGLPLAVQQFSHYLGSLGLPAMYEFDDWGGELQVNIAARRVFSPGPDGNPATPADNIPPGVGH